MENCIRSLLSQEVLSLLLSINYSFYMEVSLCSKKCHWPWQKETSLNKRPTCLYERFDFSNRKDQWAYSILKLVTKTFYFSKVTSKINIGRNLAPQRALIKKHAQRAGLPCLGSKLGYNPRRVSSSPGLQCQCADAEYVRLFTTCHFLTRFNYCFLISFLKDRNLTTNFVYLRVQLYKKKYWKKCNQRNISSNAYLFTSGSGHH